MPSYHDVVVVINGTSYHICRDYTLELTCYKVAGWCLWRNSLNKSVLLGGEYEGQDFRIEVLGHIICGKANSV